MKLVKGRLADISEAFALALVCEGQGEIFEGNKQIIAWQDPKPIYVPPHKRISWTDQQGIKTLIIHNRLTPTEMKARREKNLHYNCEEKWV